MGCDIRLPALNFRVFEAHLVLKSYKDPMIDKYDSVALLNRLHIESIERDLVRCGASICFKKGISVKGSFCKLRIAKLAAVHLCPISHVLNSFMLPDPRSCRNYENENHHTL